EQDRLNQEARASESLYTRDGGPQQMVFKQPAQPTGHTKPIVQHIQLDKLNVRHAGSGLQEQARVQNLQHYQEREEAQRQRQATAPLEVIVDQLTGAFAGQQSPQATATPPIAGGVQDVTPPPPIEPSQDAEV
ncbi:MAG: hypothetical protein GY832_30405, partial [Chloroflexi bacterium]|nr:hypothetical protein [Chloroflexota bacterium]